MARAWFGTSMVPIQCPDGPAGDWAMVAVPRTMSVTSDAPIRLVQKCMDCPHKTCVRR